MSDQFVVNVEAAIYKDDTWLMIIRSSKEEHAGGTLSMVGGTINYTDSRDTTLESALRREVMEEVGIEITKPLHYVESKSFTSDTGREVIDVVFMTPYISGEPIAIDPDEVESVHWMTYAEICAHPKTPPWIAQSMKVAEGLREKQR